jgi:hypothetical protein
MCPQKGDLVIAGEEHLKEVYLCRIYADEPSKTRNPLCEVLDILGYPIQTSCIYADIAQENPPLSQGEVCRLKVYQVCGHGAYTPREDYRSSLLSCISSALDERRDNLVEQAILLRHASGDVRGRRVLCKN